MIDINEFVNEQNVIDFPAYRQAQRDAGEICYQCGGARPEPHIGTALCEICEIQKKNQFVSTSFVRCPHCGHETMPENVVLGEQQITCEHCGNDFHYRVCVHVQLISYGA